MKKLFYSVLIFFAAISSCSESGSESGGRRSQTRGNVVREYYSTGVLKTETTVKDSLRHGPTRHYDMNGNLLSEVNYVENVKEGTVTNYYVPSGKPSSTFEYKQGIKQGDELWLYETGEKYRVTPYVDGKINGVQRYYFQSGALMAEVPYRENRVGKGLIELKEDGTPVSTHPRIVIVFEDHLRSANSVILRLSMSNNSRNVQFYRGELEDGIYIHDGLREMAVQEGTAQMSFNLPRSTMIDQKINIVANYKTGYGNQLVLDTVYHLQIYNAP